MLQLKKAVFSGQEFFLAQKKPFGMGEIAAAQKGDPFDICPAGKVIKGHVFGSGSGVFGVNMKIGDKCHDGPSVEKCRTQFKENCGTKEKSTA